MNWYKDYYQENQTMNRMDNYFSGVHWN